VAVVLTLVETKHNNKIYINETTQNTLQTIQNKSIQVNIIKTTTHYKTHTYIHPLHEGQVVLRKNVALSKSR
jgi:hypothetical protein